MDPGAKDAEDDGRDGEQDEAPHLALAFLLLRRWLQRLRR
jgi:hypothetical protein